MPETNGGFPWWLLLVGAIVALMFLGSCPRDSADTELARTAHAAVKMAHDAQTDDRSATLWVGRFRTLALILGITVPILVAYMIWRSTSSSEIDPVEVIAELERHELLESHDPTPLTLSANLEPTDVAVTSPD